ncbi:uncharacterized protein [Branchiostoma lanceolatum]|uniref:uncharacterized protein n=1 Tax=Branchiostoma lanceolatum TaxID=7740 RepID=UPI0034526E99
MPKIVKQKKYSVHCTQSAAKSASHHQGHALHREERESRREQPGAVLPLLHVQRVAETPALSAQHDDKITVSKRTSTAKRKDRRLQPYTSSWRYDDVDEQSPSRDRQGKEQDGAHHRSTSKSTCVSAVPSREEMRRPSPPRVVLTLRRVTPSPHPTGKAAVGSAKTDRDHYEVVPRNDSTTSNVSHGDTGSNKRRSATLDSDESSRQAGKRRRKISYQEYVSRKVETPGGDKSEVTSPSKVSEELTKSPTPDRKIIKAHRMSQNADKLAEVTAEISARTKALCPLTAERPETPVNTDDEAVGVRHGQDVIGHKLTSLKSPTGKTLADFVQRKIKRDERLQRLFRNKAVALAAKIGGNGTLGTGPTGHPATADLRHQRSASSERPDGRLQHNLGQSETPPGGQATDRMPPPKHPVHRSFQPRRLFQPAIPLQVGGKAQAQSRPLAETAVAGSSRDAPQGHGDENYNRSRRRPSTLQTSRPTPLRSRPIHVVYTQEEIAQGIRSIRNQMMENDRTSEAPLRQQLGDWERRHDNNPADIHGQQKASRLTYMTSGPTSLEVLENNNKLQVARNSPPPVEPPAAVMAVKADHSTILGSVTWGSMMTQSQYNTATAMAIPCMIPTTIVLAEGSCDAAATATVTQPLTPEDRIPLEEAIAMLVGREAEDNPSHCKDSPLITTGKSSIHSGFDSNLERA